MIAISTDAPEESSKLGLNYPVLSDPNLVAIDAFGVRHPEAMLGKDIARPAVFLLDPEGKVVWSDLTDNWRVRVQSETILAAIDTLSSRSQ